MNSLEPSLRLIPNARQFIRAVARTEIHNAEKHKTFIHNPVLKSLGLEDDEAFNRAVQAAKLLPEGFGPDQVKFGRTGEFSHRLLHSIQNKNSPPIGKRVFVVHNYGRTIRRIAAISQCQTA